MLYGAKKTRIRRALRFRTMKNKLVTAFTVAGIIASVGWFIFCWEDPDTITIKITSETKAFSQDVYPPGPNVYALKTSKIGMWDDTIILNGIKLPPQKVKYIGKPVDFYGEEPFKFSFDPYRAKHVKLTVIYDFYQ